MLRWFRPSGFPIHDNPHVIDAILNLVFPADCVLCGSRVTQWRSGALCPKCEGSFRRQEPPFCLRCGLPEENVDPLCGACLLGETCFDFARSALVFDEPVRSAIHHFKYNDRVSLARPLGRCLSDCLREAPFTAGVVVPVPLHRKRERQRGYNQAALLARRLGLEVREDLVRRRRPTATQTGLTRRQRVENVRGAFECPRRVPGACLVVDDVMTTGATINEVARVLRKTGACRVEVLTLTRVGTRPLR